uniref:ATP synthase protein MI25 n=1 Tax=Jaagichlorella roystonensis TaxID=1052852 RepID=A0A6C0M9J3_9CHLO|nr:ATP synthase protein MI25 [Jaagichlorella roystonensis]QHU78320.1 ATP synthase protein MI25 [Jaagichlorella roystonensis]
MMSTFREIRFYLFFFLFFTVASSKGIIIYNEETLVALSFITFVIFCFNYFGHLIKDSLDERSSLIRTSLENFHRLKEHALQESLSQHKQIKKLKKIFPSVGSFTENQMVYTSLSGDQKVTLYNSFCSQIVQKLGSFQSSKTLLQQGLQKSIALTIPTLVLAKIKQREKQESKTGSMTANQSGTSSYRGLSTQVKQSLKILKG